MKTLTIAKELQDAINDYAKLKLGSKEVVTPYLINKRNNRDLRVMVGKGTPTEIKVEARIWEKLKGVNFDSMSQDEIKQFLSDKRIGIDCSGFIVEVLDMWYFANHKKHIFNQFKLGKNSIYRNLKFRLRPVENLGADLITNEDNCIKIPVKDVKPYDLIRSKAASKVGDHVMLVTSVEYDDNDIPLKIEYTHSTPHYGSLNGIKRGEIKITDPNKPLESQEWLEVDENGKNYTYEGYLTNLEDNGIRRLKFLNT